MELREQFRRYHPDIHAPVYRLPKPPTREDHSCARALKSLRLFPPSLHIEAYVFRFQACQVVAYIDAKSVLVCRR